LKRLSAFLQSKDDTTLGILSCLVGNVIFGLSFMFTRIAQRSAMPEVQLSLRFLFALVLMTALLMVQHKMPSLKGRRKWPLLVFAVLVVAIFYTESLSVYYSNSSFVSLVLSILPVVSMVLAFFFLKERPNRRQVIFSFFPVIGVVFITLANSSMGAIRPLGVLFTAASLLTTAVTRTFNRHLANEFSTPERTYTMILACSVFFTVTSLIKLKGDLAPFAYALSQPSFIASSLALCILCSIVGELLNNYAYTRLPMVQISSIGTISTVVGVLAGIILLREPVNALSAFGAVLTVFGIWQVNRSDGKPTDSPA